MHYFPRPLPWWRAGNAAVCVMSAARPGARGPLGCFHGALRCRTGTRHCGGRCLEHSAPVYDDVVPCGMAFASVAEQGMRDMSAVARR